MDPIEALLQPVEHPAYNGQRSANRDGAVGRLYPAFHRNPGRPAPACFTDDFPRDLTNATNFAVNSLEERHLDDFDKELLAEPFVDRQWQASQGLARLSLPSRLLRTPRKEMSSSYFANGGSVPSPHAGQSSSPLPSGPVSSPSMNVGRQRQADVFTKASQKLTEDRHGSTAAPALSDNEPAGQEPHHSGQSMRRVIELGHAPPTVQGIPLVPINKLPDRFRSLFFFPVFNAVQSKCFSLVYQNDDNLVLSAPTGSGKTVVMELAICRLISSLKSGQFKVVYQAPTKSLCSERYRDWQRKFSSLDLQCAELTGDTDHTQLKSVQTASIIITTPEKWDSVTRKWKDHAKLMQLVKLFLIDEVHMLKESRGATLEAVVSRMKSVGSDVRFVALSATVPNSEDIATWLGRNPSTQWLPANREVFGEEFRPVKLQKFVYGFPAKANDFVFDKILDAKLPEVIAKHSSRKPIMVFCFTRKSSIQTSKILSTLWASTDRAHRLWPAPQQTIIVQDPELRGTVVSGVAFHHAGLDSADRHSVEQGFLNGQVSIICCTSTLAVGVNLPCHLVIIKNTVAYVDNGCHEYSDLEMMQMLGRAGRPQFDSSATAVILTKDERVKHYERLVSGQDDLESCLHLNLLDHLNAEVGLGTINNFESAKQWLAGTFLFVRLRKNPDHYRLKEGAACHNSDELLEEICDKDIKLLQENRLVSSQDPLRSTEFGDAMARYYVKFATMKIFLAIPPHAKMSEILSSIAQADEFKDVRFKSGEKSLYKEINRDISIKFPIKVDLALPAHKISLLMQAELGGVEFPNNDQFAKHKMQFSQDKAIIFQQVNRLIRCIIDCQIHLGDSIGVRHALELARSFGSRAWDNSPLQMKQIDQIGPMAVRKLANAGINSVEALEATEQHRIEMLLGKNPPFGAKLLGRLSGFPKPRVTVKMIGKETKPGKPVTAKVKAEIGFLNETVPAFFKKRPVYVCFLAERSDGCLMEFRRMSATKLQNGHDVLLSVDLVNVKQFITCYVMCDEIAGTLQYAELKPDLPAALFPPPSRGATSVVDRQTAASTLVDQIGARQRSENIIREEDYDFGGDGLNDDELLAADNPDFISFDDLDEFHKVDLTSTSKLSQPKEPAQHGNEEVTRQPVQLENGKWACNHKCKDKTSCKHMCCREGLDKPQAPKAVRKETAAEEPASSKNAQAPVLAKAGHKALPKEKSKKPQPAPDLASNKLNHLHARTAGPTPVQSTLHASPTHGFKKGAQLQLSFLSQSPPARARKAGTSSEFDAEWMEDMPSPSALLNPAGSATVDDIKTSKARADEIQDYVYKDDLSNSEPNGVQPTLPSRAGSKQTPTRLDRSSSSHTLHQYTPQERERRQSPFDDFDFDFSMPELNDLEDTSQAKVLPDATKPTKLFSQPSSSLFVTGNSSSPGKVQGRPKWLTDLSRKREAEQDPADESQPAKKSKSNNDVHTPLQEVQNLPVTQAGDVLPQVEEEKDPWADFDPEFAAQFRHLVEIV